MKIGEVLSTLVVERMGACAQCALVEFRLVMFLAVLDEIQIVVFLMAFVAQLRTFCRSATKLCFLKLFHESDIPCIFGLDCFEGALTDTIAVVTRVHLFTTWPAVDLSTIFLIGVLGVATGRLSR